MDLAHYEQKLKSKNLHSVQNKNVKHLTLTDLCNLI